MGKMLKSLLIAKLLKMSKKLAKLLILNLIIIFFCLIDFVILKKNYNKIIVIKL